MLADSGLLERFLANLMANAASYSPTGEHVLTASSHNDRVDLRISDRGPGTPAPASAGPASRRQTAWVTGSCDFSQTSRGRE